MKQVNLRKVGGSVVLAIPPAFLEQLNLAPGQAVGLAVENGSIVICPDLTPRPNLHEMLSRITEANRHPEMRQSEYEIFSHEINQKKTVRAPGIAEAMLDYLPWPTLSVDINWQPGSGIAKVIDNQTDFRYTVKIK